MHAIHTFSKSAFHRRSERHLAVATATACNTAWRPHRDLFAVAGVIQRAKQFHSESRRRISTLKCRPFFNFGRNIGHRCKSGKIWLRSRTNRDMITCDSVRPKFASHVWRRKGNAEQFINLKRKIEKPQKGDATSNRNRNCPDRDRKHAVSATICFKDCY